MTEELLNKACEITSGKVRDGIRFYYVEGYDDGRLEISGLPDSKYSREIVIRIRALEHVVDVVPAKYGLRVIVKDESDWTELNAQICAIMQPYTHPAGQGRH